jgi:Rha family phage regulatory protein
MKESNFHSMIQANQITQTKENAMSELSNLHSNRTMSSREIAALTGKLHKNVIQDIRNLIEQGAISGLNFQPAEYADAQGKPRPEYLLDFDATMTLVTGYNAVLRAKVIKRWRELEEGTAQPAILSSLTKEELEARSLRAKKDIFETLCEAAKLFGLEGNQALLKADKSLKKDYGDSFITRLEIELKSPDNEALLIATEIGKRLDPPVSAKQVNLLLANMKLQEKVEYRAGKFEWRLTDRGKAYGSYLDTGKVHSNGTPIQQIKWKESILPLVQKHSDSL